MPLYSLLSSTETSHKPELEKAASSAQRSSFDSEETCTVSSRRLPRHWHRRSESAWIISTITLAITTLSLLLYLVTIDREYSCSRYGNFESGFKTDLGKSENALSPACERHISTFNRHLHPVLMLTPSLYPVSRSCKTVYRWSIKIIFRRFGVP